MLTYGESAYRHRANWFTAHCKLQSVMEAQAFSDLKDSLIHVKSLLIALVSVTYCIDRLLALFKLNIHHIIWVIRTLVMCKC